MKKNRGLILQATREHTHSTQQVSVISKEESLAQLLSHLSANKFEFVLLPAEQYCKRGSKEGRLLRRKYRTKPHFTGELSFEHYAAQQQRRAATRHFSLHVYEGLQGGEETGRVLVVDGEPGQRVGSGGGGRARQHPSASAEQDNRSSRGHRSGEDTTYFVYSSS